MPEADTVHELLAISLYDLFLMTGKPMDAAQLASKAMEKYDRPSFWALHAALAHFEADDYMRAIPELLKHVPDEIDMKQFLGWTLLARLGAERNERVWQGLRPYVFQPANPRKARIAIELAWHYGERDTCSRFAKYMLEEPLLALSIHRRHRAFFEAVAAGRCPNAETMKERVERRASAWEASGRHTSMLLSGFEFVCAYCRFGGRNKELSDAGLALIEKSYAKVGERGYWKILHTRSSCCMCRSKWRIENLGICGFCHRHYCCDCASSGTRCGCGGEIVG
jgi:hypothetical protein